MPIAHRGLHDGAAAPENSAAAIARAAEAGCAVEIDVRICADARLVLFHDETLERLTEARGPVRARPAAELRRLRLLGGAETILTLEEALELAAGRAPLLIELKHAGPAGAPEALLAAALARYAGPAAVQSFNPRSLWWFRRNAPLLARGQLSGRFPDAPRPPWPMRAALRGMWFNALTRPDFIGYDLRAGDAAFFRRLRRRTPGPLLLWTARTEADAALCRAVGATPIFERMPPPAMRDAPPDEPRDAPPRIG
ncbi:MAG: glycerophosphodiester phosphodiesterase family protein [Pseudomonadota bacterium]